MNKYINKFKRIISILLVSIMLISCTGCRLTSFIEQIANLNPQENELVEDNHAAKDNEAFNKYTEQLFQELISEDTISLHSFIQNPESFGIKDYDVTLGRYDLDNLNDTSSYTDAITTLKAFDKNTLSEKQQLTYDELLKMFETNLEYADLALYSSQLQIDTGVQIQLPIFFSEYIILCKKDVEEYLQLLCDVDGYFENLIAYEGLRSKQGLFMEDYLADEIIKGCNSFLSTALASDGALISSFEEKINSLTELSDSEKASYKALNKEYISDHVVKGYKLLIDGITSLKGTNKYPGGICNYPDGKRYFSGVLQETLGWNKSVEEYNTLLDNNLTADLFKIQTAILKNPSLSEAFESFSFNMSDPSEILEDLKLKIQDDFPKIPDTTYDIKYVAKALEEYCSPAMYFLPQLDNLSINSIYINKSSSDTQELYATLAHEGYPGHLYQTQYFAASKPNNLRYIIAPGGYVEGWASYVEVMSYLYANTGNEALNSLYSTNYHTILCIYAKGDIGVNYYGWSQDDLYKYIKGYGFDDKAIAKEMYYSFISNPGNYCQYVLGLLAFEELKNTAKTQLGDRFNIKEFHRFVLDLGPIQFDIIFSKLPAWIQKEKTKFI